MNTPPRLPAHPNAPTSTPIPTFDFSHGDFSMLNGAVDVSNEWNEFLQSMHPASTSHKRARIDDLGLDSGGHMRTKLPMIRIPSAMSLHTEDGGTIDLAAAINFLHTSINYQNHLYSQLSHEHMNTQNGIKIAELEDKVEQMGKVIEELRNAPAQGRVKKSKTCDTVLVVCVSLDACHSAACHDPTRVMYKATVQAVQDS
ncbi:hypothetical protein HWV62_15613 [Athelia sp. TMB]|nr:hypothetical protein HWV62_15613 [Athelia sp. TMB]